jgi:signal transduction histidine kinase
MEALPIQVLLIEDNAADAEIVREMLEGVRRAFRIDVVSRLAVGIRALNENHFDVVLVDLNLPDSSGIDTFLAIHAACPELPIILLTGLEDEQIAEQAVKEGAQDYLVKNQIDGKLLDRSIRYAIERKKILRENVRLYDEAERASRAKDQFVAMLSHELRTPLTAILGWSVLLRDGPMDSENAKRAAKTIEQNARLQGRIIDDLLDVSRIVTGKLMLKVGPVMLANVIQSAVDSVRSAADTKQLTIVCDYDPEVPPISGDADRLQQVFWNILSNSTKFTPKGGRIEIALRNAGGEAEIVIRDNGSGISPDVLPHIFEPFRQADSSASRVHGGLGLGLSIVRHLVEMHGGTVEAFSEGTDRGSQFTMRFPVLDSRVLQRGDAPWPLSTARLDGCSVLVVDDEIEHAGLLKVILEQSGASVIVGTNASQGFDLFNAHRPDVLLTDIGLPSHDGYYLLKQVREAEKSNGLQRTPAAAITAYGREEDKSRIISAGFDAFLGKPIEPSAVIELVQDLCRRIPSDRRAAG